MKITNLKYNNIFGTEAFEDTPDKVNVLLAHNGAGKTTYIKSLRYALTGEMDSSDFVRTGASEAYTSITVDGNTIERKSGGSGSKVSLNGKTTTQKSIGELYASQGVSSKVMKVVTSSEVLGSMDAGALSKFFLESDIIPVSIDADKLVAMCAPLTPDAEKELREFFPSMPEKFGLEDIKKGYKEYYDCRTKVGAELKAARAKAAVLGTMSKPEMTVDEIDKQIIALEKAMDSKELTAYNAAVKKREEVQAQIATLKERLEANKSTRPVPGVPEKLQSEKETISAEIQKKKSLIAVLDANIHQTEQILTNLASSTCPIHKDIVCKTDKTPLKNTLTETLEKTKEEAEKLKSEISSLEASLKDVEGKITAYRENEKSYEAKKALYDKIKLLEGNMPEILPKPAYNAETAKKASDKIAVLKKYRSDVIAYENALEEQKKAEQLQAVYDIAETIVNKLSPKSGIREAILDMAVEPLIEECNKTAKMLKLGFEIKADISNGFRVLAQVGSRGFHDFANLSNGEKAIVELLIMDMLNMLTGFGILVLDNLDSLDEDTFTNLMAVIDSSDFKDRYDHIFISAVDHVDIKNAVSKYPSVHKIM